MHLYAPKDYGNPADIDRFSDALKQTESLAKNHLDRIGNIETQAKNASERINNIESEISKYKEELKIAIKQMKEESIKNALILG